MSIQSFLRRLSIAAEILNFPRRIVITIIINPDTHILIFVNSIGVFDELLKNPCAATPELAHIIPANPTKTNAKFLFITIPSSNSTNHGQSVADSMRQFNAITCHVISCADMIFFRRS